MERPLPTSLPCTSTASRQAHSVGLGCSGPSGQRCRAEGDRRHLGLRAVASAALCGHVLRACGTSAPSRQRLVSRAPAVHRRVEDQSAQDNERRTDGYTPSTGGTNLVEVKEEKSSSSTSGEEAESVAPLEAGGAGDLLEPALAQLRSELLPISMPGLGKSDEEKPPPEEQAQAKDPSWNWLWIPASAVLSTTVALGVLLPGLRPDLPGLGSDQGQAPPAVQKAPVSAPAVPPPDPLAGLPAPPSGMLKVSTEQMQGGETAKSIKTPQKPIKETSKASYLQDIMASEVQDASFARWYAQATEAAKEATSRLITPKADGEERQNPVENGVPKSVVQKLRGIGDVLDDAQQDIYDETWVSLATYADVLHAYRPLFAYYNANGDAYGGLATPAINEAVRDALVFEEKHLFTAVSDFEKAVQERKIRVVEKAFAEMSLAYDRYLKAGALYAGYDPVTTIWYQGVDDKRLVYTPLALAQPRIRDEIIVLRGSDKGKVGKVIWIGRDQDGTAKTTVVKLAPNPVLGNVDRAKRGVREVKAYPFDWIAITRNERQSYIRDLALATAAALVSCAITYPVDTIKSRLQSNLPAIPPGGPPDLFNGLAFNLGREAPNAGFLMAGFNFLTRQAVALPFVDANNPDIKFLVMIPAGILANASGIFIRTPFELLNKQLQTGQSKTEAEAVQKVFLSKPQAEVWNTLFFTGSLVLLRGVPFGALQCTFYEIFKERLPLGDFDIPLSFEPLVWGALAGFLTGLLTNPPDVILTRAASNLEASEGNFIEKVSDAIAKINAEEGPEGFLKGAWARAAYFAPEAMLWFAVYEYLTNLFPDAFA